MRHLPVYTAHLVQCPMMEEEHRIGCFSWCLVCLSAAWSCVKTTICCRCGFLARLAPQVSSPEEEQERKEVSEGLVVQDIESDPEGNLGSPLPPRQTRVRFGSIVEVFHLILPRRTWRQRIQERVTPSPIVERTVEETKKL